MNPASARMAIMIGIIATMRLNARPDARLNTQSLLNFAINACRDLKPFTPVFTTPGEVDDVSFNPAHRFSWRICPCVRGRSALPCSPSNRSVRARTSVVGNCQKAHSPSLLQARHTDRRPGPLRQVRHQHQGRCLLHGYRLPETTSLTLRLPG